MSHQYDNAGHAAGIIIGLAIALLLSAAIIASLFIPFSPLGISPILIWLAQSVFALNAYTAAIFLIVPQLSKNQDSLSNPIPNHKNNYPIYFGIVTYLFTYPFGWLGKKIGRLCSSPSQTNNQIETSTSSIMTQLEIANIAHDAENAISLDEPTPASSPQTSPIPIPEPDQALPLLRATPWQ